MRAILLVLTSAACAGAPHAQEAAIGDPCDPERPCSSHFGLCIRCDAEGDPRWVWSDALGAVNGSTHDWNFTLSVFEPSCDEHTFDERGRPLTQQGAGNPDGERIAFRYDAERVVRVETDRPRMCPDDLAAEVQCGPPDGRPDQVLDVAYRADAESTVAEISSSGTVLATRRYDAHGRIVEIRTPRAVRRYEYDGGARASIEREEEDDRTAVVERDARGRIRRECAGTDCDGRDVRSTYDDAGRPVASDRNDMGRASHSRWTHRVDARGRAFASTLVLENPEGVQTIHIARRFDGDGFLVDESSERGHLRIERGARGRPIRVHDGDRVTDYSCLSQALWDALLTE